MREPESRNICRSKKEVLVGYGEYDKPLLVTFMNSGTNWIRWNIEFFTGKKTPGCKRLEEDGEYIIDRAHFPQERIHNYKKVILGIRDYKEIFPQRFIHNGGDINSVKSYNDLISYGIYNYIYNIIEYDKFIGEKRAYYYDDIFCPEEIRKILEFLDIFDDKNFETYKKYFDAILKKSYESKSGESNGDLKYWSKKLPKEILLELDDFMLEKCGEEIFNKYLKRYKIK